MKNFKVGDEVFCLNSQKAFKDKTVYIIYDFIENNNNKVAAFLHEKGSIWTDEDGGFFKLPNGDRGFSQTVAIDDIISVEESLDELLLKLSEEIKRVYNSVVPKHLRNKEN